MTFDGIAKACAKAAGAPEPELIHYNPKDFDFGGKKAFPLRDQHFFASIDKVCAVSRELACRKLEASEVTSLFLSHRPCSIMVMSAAGATYNAGSLVCAGYSRPGLGS